MNNTDLFKNLQALEKASFPKACENCGTEYQNERELIEKTTPYSKSPRLEASHDQSGKTYLKLARKCLCGKAFVDHFGDRRDTTAQGELKRQAFEKVILSLIERGISRDSARRELINHMKNRPSKLLQDLGIFNR